MPRYNFWELRAEGSWFNRTQNIPLFQKGVAFPELTHFLALDADQGIKGVLLMSTTGTLWLYFSLFMKETILHETWNI